MKSLFSLTLPTNQKKLINEVLSHSMCKLVCDATVVKGGDLRDQQEASSQQKLNG
ncbi:hypothetical protein PSFL107428_15645 [Pseudoalteromonas maricaloris]